MSHICVIVPVYDAEAYLHRCIDSVLRQTLQEFELILVDDGSPDNCGIICDEYARQDERIHVIHQENRGLSATRNAGLDYVFEHLTCDWISFIDSDDWVHPRYLEALYQAAIENNVQIAACNHVRTKGETPTDDESHLDAIVMTAKAYYCGAGGSAPAAVAWGKLYRKECFQNIRYPVGRWHEDEFITHHILFPCKKMAWISQPLYAYYQNPHGIMQTVNVRKHCLDLIDALDDQIQFFEKRCLRLEMHRLKICMEKIRFAESAAEMFSEDDLRHVAEIKNRLMKNHRGILTVMNLIENCRIKDMMKYFAH